MIAPLADNIVRKQLPRLIADAEWLLTVAAWSDLPAGVRIIDIPGGAISGFCLGSGHRFAQAHGCRPGAVAFAVAAEDALRCGLRRWPDELPIAMAEAGVMIETVAAHEMAHALVADIDGDLLPGQSSLLRQLPAAVGSAVVVAADDFAERKARDHGAAWAAAIVILSQRCRQYRPGARHRWDVLIKRDLQAVGIDADAVEEAVVDVADELPLRDLLQPGSAVVARVAAAIPNQSQRAALIAAALHETTPDQPGRVAQAVAGVALEEREHGN